MPAGYTSPEDVINAGLRECGYAREINDIYEGSRASRVAVDIYGATRDALLHAGNWDFALRQNALTLTAAQNGILGFAYEYIYPPDAIRICYVYPRVLNTNFDPQPVRWVVANDLFLAPKAQVIYTNIAAARCSYVGKITNPLTWNPAFTRAMVRWLAEIFAFALKDDLNMGRLRMQLADQSAALAMSVGDALPPLPPELMARAAAAAQRQ